MPSGFARWRVVALVAGLPMLLWLLSVETVSQERVVMPPPRATLPTTASSLDVAVTVLLTTRQSKGSGSLDETVDSLLVLRESLLDQSVPLKEGRHANSAHRLSFVVLITPEVDQRWSAVLRWLGFLVQVTESPIQPSEVRNKRIAKEVVTDGAIGISEMIKVQGFVLDGFDLVLMVDCDVLFHQSVDLLVADLFAPYPPSRSRLSSTAALGWTKGGWAIERINGGFLVFNPHAQGREHHDAIIDILREGDFRDGTERGKPGIGWRGSNIGYCYGGRTIQGLLPYYFFGVRKPGEADKQLDRCRYNNMVQLPECKAIDPERVVSNHFTGECQKPWWCVKPPHPLCARFTNAWFDVRARALARLRHAVDPFEDIRASLQSDSPGCSTFSKGPPTPFVRKLLPFATTLANAT